MIDMFGLAKNAAEYSSREDDLIHNIDRSSHEKRQLQSSISSELENQIILAKLKHLGIGTGVGALGGGLIGAIASGEAEGGLGGAIIGGSLGMFGGAISGAIKGDDIFREKDPNLYNAIQRATAQEHSSHAALARHHQLREFYAPAQRPLQVQMVPTQQERARSRY
jgi:hypothetical protein